MTEMQFLLENFVLEIVFLSREGENKPQFLDLLGAALTLA